MERERHISTAKIGIAAVAILLALALLFFAAYRIFRLRTAAQDFPGQELSKVEDTVGAHPSFIFGRVTTHDNVVYEGRLRFGGDEEAFWGQYFNGSQAENPWAVYVPVEQLTKDEPLEILGFKINRRVEVDLHRPFMARFGDLARVESNGWTTLRVTLKSGTPQELDLFAADDFADGIRVWDAMHGVVDLEEGEIRSIDFRAATGKPGAIADQLRGTVSTQGGGKFSGFIEWGPRQSVGSDVLSGDTAKGGQGLRFDRIRSIVQQVPGNWLVTLRSGEDMRSDNRELPDNTGIYVDDQRYGRVLIPWRTFERVDFDSAENGPAYGDFPAGRPLRGEVSTRAGRRLSGRLVYDLDESETTHTLDAPSQGVDYNIPLALVASIALPPPGERNTARATVALTNGETLQFELSGDLGDQNLGMLVFHGGESKPEYLRWSDITHIRFDSR